MQAVISSGERSSHVQDLSLLDVTPVFMDLEATGRAMTELIQCNTATPTKKGHTFIAIESLDVCMKGGMEFEAWFSCGCGNPSCATIVQVSRSKKRAKATVKVS